MDLHNWRFRCIRPNAAHRRACLEALSRLTSGTTYYYRIRAMNGTADGDLGAWSATDEESTDGATSATTPSGVPGALTLPTVAAKSVGGDVTLATASSSLSVSWTRPTDNGGSAITSYELQVWDSVNSRWVLETSKAAVAANEVADGPMYTYDDTGLSPGKTYYYIVRARNTEGAGPWSQFGYAKTVVRGPGIPTLEAVVISTSEIRLTWSVADNGGAVITDYNLQRWTGTTWGADLLGEDSAVTLYIDRGDVGADDVLTPLAAGTSYYYRINASNGTEGEYTTALTVQTMAGVPERPTGLTATHLSNSQIQLAWTAPEKNNGSPIDHYELEVWNTTNKAWDRIGGNLRGPDLRYTHSRLTAETNYVYRVRAVNGAPANSGQGPYSTLAIGTTPK